MKSLSLIYARKRKTTSSLYCNNAVVKTLLIKYHHVYDNKLLY